MHNRAQVNLQCCMCQEGKADFARTLSAILQCNIEIVQYFDTIGKTMLHRNKEKI